MFSHIFDRILRVESEIRLSQRNRLPSPGRETLPSQTRLETQGCECWEMALPLLQQLLQLRCGGSWMLLNVLRLTEVNLGSKALQLRKLLLDGGLCAPYNERIRMRF